MAVLLTGCSTFNRHTGKEAIKLSHDSIAAYPMQADMQVLQPIKGVAVCESWVGGLYTKKPASQNFGASLQVSKGNIAWDECTRGAIYDALSKNKAEYIVAPTYNTTKKRDLCLLGICLHKTYTVEVTGYKAVIKDFQPMDKELVKSMYGRPVSITSTHVTWSQF